MKTSFTMLAQRTIDVLKTDERLGCSLWQESSMPCLLSESGINVKDTFGIAGQVTH
jgi:hypothetical protein